MALRCLARPPGVMVAHPLLTAAAGDAHPPGTTAPEARGAHAQAQGCAAHGAVHAGAVVLAVGLEGLAVGVAHPVQDAAHADHLCKHSVLGSGRLGTTPLRGHRRPLDLAPPPGSAPRGGRRSRRTKQGPSRPPGVWGDLSRGSEGAWGAAQPPAIKGPRGARLAVVRR